MEPEGENYGFRKTITYFNFVVVFGLKSKI